MLKDITIGQYFPGTSVVHRIDARFKIVITAVFIVMLFSASNYSALCVPLVFFAIAFMASKLSAKLMIKSMKPIVPVIIITSILNIFFIDGVSVIKIWKLNITDNGLYTSGFMIIRLIALICGSSLLTYTTSPITLTDALEQMLKPLAKIKFPAHELAMMMTIALRFIPTLIEETDKIMQAQKARGAELDSGSIPQRAKALVPILIPLFVSSFRRAEELALAMECRCYNGGEGRTKLKTLVSGGKDYAALSLSIFFLSVVFILDLGKVSF
ncbi:MAG: energy-coupling factor transporter transmembrane protein EcfT [Oscillospiraceae bacterium]|nr:energy-coupling factor transporter transmembrane protein EcfT [Oscillospiraceae bacterium]MBR4346439.1 energy-coupling factor transporter transmembrane protein EcfT [Oscillospiraceae bacterium]